MSQLHRLVGLVLMIFLTAVTVHAQIPFAGLGDSIGEGVQSADANEYTQPYSYLHLIALRAGTPFPLPLIRSGLFGMVGDTGSRTRISPTVQSFNLAVSGADVASLLYDRADAATTAQINSETDLVLYPRIGSQMEVAEALRPALVASWIGNNDVLGAVTAFDQMNVSQMTSIPDFFTDFFWNAARLKAINARVVFGTIPDVSRIGFLVDRNDLIRFIGSDHGLPATSRTSIITMTMIGLGLTSPTVLQDPNYVLDAAEMAAISERTLVFNQVIYMMANYFGMGVADIHQRFEQYSTNPPVINGITLTNKFLGGLFSLDGVHPSNIAHGLVANEFISRFNSTYGTTIAPLDPATLTYLLNTDPFVDLNRNGRVRGRPWAGFLEFLSAVIGFSGDSESALTSGSAREVVFAQAARANFVEEYRKAKGKDLTKMSSNELNDAFREIFGLDRLKKKNR